MRNSNFKSSVLFILLSVVFIMTATAQPRGQGRGFDSGQRIVCNEIPDLTEEQQKQIQSLRTEQVKKSTLHRSQMNELRTQKKSLMLQDNPDMTEINNKIDQMALLRGEQLKRNAAHRQSIRALLTDEQRVYFDSRQMRQGRRPAMRESDYNRSGRGMKSKGMYRH